MIRKGEIIAISTNVYPAACPSLLLLDLHRGGRFDLDQAGADDLRQRRHRRESL